MDRLKALLLTVLPHHLISRILFFASRLEHKSWQQFLIKRYIKMFKVDLHQAQYQSAKEYRTLNEFFTRELLTSARPINFAHDVLVSPVDGQISQIGRLSSGQLLQAKGRHYEVAALLGESYETCFDEGAFATIYLSPKDYHRIHMPMNGSVDNISYIPGRLFSVAPFCVENVSSVFARNERVVCIFNTELGKMALVLVGAINVSAIETTWEGLITPKRGQQAFNKHYDNEEVSIDKGTEMGRFNMGSTVILITSGDKIEWLESCTAGTSLNMGEKIAAVINPANSGMKSHL